MPATRVSRLVVALAVGLLMVLGASAGISAQSVFINEIHYDNASTDTGEAIEIAGPAGTDLSGWSIVRYNGNTPASAVVYTSPAATETLPAGTVIPNLCGGFGVVVISYPQDGLQNGPNDGLALVDNAGSMVQLLSYEGQLTASNGPAAGLTSQDIGVAEPTTTAMGSSLQLGGTGTTYQDFNWNPAAPHTFGACNTGQTFSSGDVPPTVSQTIPRNGATDVPVNTTITVAFSEAVSAAQSAFHITCDDSGAISLTLSGGPQTYTLTPTAPLPAQDTCTVTVIAAEVTDQDAPLQPLRDDFIVSFTTGIAFGACGDTATPIHDIQGAGLTSPLQGDIVVIEGIVVGAFQDTTTQLSGFYVQEEDNAWDNDDATSEGLFIFDNGFGVAVTMGDRVRVQGRVSEFLSSGTTLTELNSVTHVVVCSSHNAFSRKTLTLPVDDNPTAWERYEGMAIRIEQVLTVTETFNLGSFGELVLAVDRLPNPTHLVSPGDAANALQALNDRSRIVLDDGSNLARQRLDPTPYPEAGGLDADAGRTVRVGDRVHPIEGVLEQRFGTYRIQPTGPIFFDPPDNPRTVEPAAVGGRVRLASFNVLNYFTTLDTGEPACGPTGELDCRGANTAEEFTRQRDKIVNALVAINAHIVGLIELENNSTDSIQTDSIQNLVDALNAATQPGRYTFINTGTIGTDAIKVGFIYQPTVVTPVGSHAVLDSTVDPRAITTQNRPALAQTFRRNGVRSDLQLFTAVVNHFKSKGSACDKNPPEPGELFDPDTDDGQDNCKLTRTSMAQALIDWLATNPTHEPASAVDRKILIIGDLNAYAQEHPIQALTDPTFHLDGFPANPHAMYTNMIEAFLGSESYSFVFQGQSGYLDHALANPALRPLVTGVTEWHINADEPVALDYNLEWTSTIAKTPNQQDTLYAPDAFRSSDHDPLIVGLNPLCGDLDDNGEVDTKDLLHFLAASRPGTYHRRADYDSNGVINARDLLLWLRCQLQFKIPAR